MLNNDSLQDVEISNYNSIEELTLMSDMPLQNQFNFSFIVFFIVLFSTFFLSFSHSLHNKFQIIANKYDIISSSSTWTHHIKPKIENISPQMSSFLQTVVLSTSISKDIDLKSGSIAEVFEKSSFLKFKPYLSSEIYLFKDGQQLKFLNMTLLNSKIFDKIQNSSPNDRLNSIYYFTKEKVYFVFDLFFSESVVFDSIQIDINLYGKISNNEKITTITKTQNPYMNFVVSILRIICSIILVNEILYSFFNYNNLKSIPLPIKKHQRDRKVSNYAIKNDNTSQTVNTEFILTLVLTVLCLFYVDPLFLIHFFMPSTFHLVFKVAFRDLFFSYLFFYTIEIFNYFERRNKIHNINSESSNISDEDNDKSSWHRITTFIATIIIFFILFVQDTKIQAFYSVYPKIPFLRFNSNSLDEKLNFEIYSNSIPVSEFNSEFGHLSNRLNVEFDSLNIWHFIILAITVVILPINIFSTYPYTKKTEASNRYAYYSIMTLTLLILLISYSLIRIHFFTSSWKTIPVDHFYSKNVHKLVGGKKASSIDDGDFCFVSESFFCTVFPMVLFTLYTALMARGHHSVDNIVSKSDQYVNPSLVENSLNVDVDELKSFIK